MTEFTRPKRRTIRMGHYDYGSVGGYFVTMCTEDRRLVFTDRTLQRIVQAAWAEIPNHHPHVQVDQFVVMPNHVHGVLFLTEDDRAQPRAQQAAPLPPNRPFVPSGSLGAIVRSFKSRVTRDIRLALRHETFVVWQRNYHEHVIRNELALQRIRQYILDNPVRWQFDNENAAGASDCEEQLFDAWLGSQQRPSRNR